MLPFYVDADERVQAGGHVREAAPAVRRGADAQARQCAAGALVHRWLAGSDATRREAPDAPGEGHAANPCRLQRPEPRLLAVQRRRRPHRARLPPLGRRLRRRHRPAARDRDPRAGRPPGLCGKRRLPHLRAAVKRLKRLENATTHVDAGHSNWQPPKRMAKRLKRVGATHYALNVSNFQRTQDLIAYGHKVSPTMHFVIDTSRNGRGPWHGKEDWCNPPDRGLGARPTTATGDPIVDALLWIKAPGESDGECADGKAPPAGHWWPRYALNLARRAVPPL